MKTINEKDKKRRWNTAKFGEDSKIQRFTYKTHRTAYSIVAENVFSYGTSHDANQRGAS